MKLFKNESGRSMVEMLAVVALIGVLSIGGIVAYNTARNQIALNKVPDVINFFSMSLDVKRPIYEQFKKEDGKLSTTGVTQLFADTYGIKDVKDNLISFGDQIRLNVFTAGDKVAMEFSLKNASRDNASDMQLAAQLTERIHHAIKVNPVLRNRLSGLWALGGMCVYNFGTKDDTDIEAGFEMFKDPECWGNLMIDINFLYDL